MVVHLSLKNGSPIFVNFRNVISFCKSEGDEGTNLRMVDDRNICVKENIDVVYQNYISAKGN